MDKAKEVLFYTPFLVETKQKEVDDISAMLSVWENDFLSGWNLEIWNKLEKLEKHQPPSGIDKALNLSRVFLKWFWPSLALSIVAYFGIWSSLFLAVILLPIQAIMAIYLLLKLYLFICVSSAFNLAALFDAKGMVE